MSTILYLTVHSFSFFQETLVADYLNSKNVDEAVNAVREMKAPKHFLSEMLNKIVVYTLDRSDEDKEHASTLIQALCAEGLATGENLMQVSGVCFYHMNIKQLFSTNCSVFIA